MITQSLDNKKTVQMFELKILKIAQCVLMEMTDAEIFQKQIQTFKFHSYPETTSGLHRFNKVMALLPHR